MQPSYRFYLISMLLMIALSGCADDGMVDIAGQVSVDGDSVAQGTISFFPVNHQGATAEAVIADGNYSVSMPKGEKKVVIRGYKKVGERFPWGKDNPPADILKEIVPKEFNDESSLTFNATADSATANFELTAK